MPVNGTVAQGRAAFDRRAWGAACALLASATDVEDVERLAVAAHLAGRDDESDAGLGARPIASTCGSARSTPRRGARSGWASRSCCAARARGRAAGWRAPSGSSQGSDGVGRGYLRLPVFLAALDADDGPTAATLAAEIVEVAQRCGDEDLRALGVLSQGQAALVLGESGRSMTLLDEVMVLVTATVARRSSPASCTARWSRRAWPRPT